jgi:uncharacterized protein
MRLSREMIKHLAEAITASLETKGMAGYSAPGAVVTETIIETITANMLEEDKLNADVEKLLSAHEADIADGRLDYRKVFELTKQKLAKDRGVVL